MRRICVVSVVSMMLLMSTSGLTQGKSVQHGIERVKRLTVTLGTKTLQAVVADTEPLRVRGLLGWQSINDDQGMLLVFDREGQYAIHMQGMKFPIDALWINSKGRILLIYRNIQPDAGHAFPSFYPSRYCLEIKAGLCDRHGIKEGQTAVFGSVESMDK